MRLRSAALAAGSAALCILAPLAAKAQTVLDRYTVRGCFTGALSVNRDQSLIRGQVACVDGTAALVLRPEGAAGQGLLTFEGALTKQFHPEFAGAGAAIASGGMILADYTSALTESALTGDGFLQPPGSPSAGQSPWRSPPPSTRRRGS